jgi:hypothetical protein
MPALTLMWMWTAWLLQSLQDALGVGR